MQIRIDDESIGSIVWKLPDDLVEFLSLTGPETQALVLEELEKHITGYALILTGSLRLGPDFFEATEMIKQNQVALGKELIERFSVKTEGSTEIH